jgi:hypothetical protein
MRTEASKRPGTCGAVLLASIVAVTAIGVSGPSLATCGVSSGASTGLHPAGANTGVQMGMHTGTTSPSSCPSMTNKTITATAASGGGIAGVPRNSIGGTHRNFQATSLKTSSSHTGTVNNKTVPKS